MTENTNDSPRQGFFRTRGVRAAKTFFWVSVVTILIWVYADLEKTETEEFHAKLVLSLGDSGDVAFLDAPDMRRQDLEVSFRASGSRGGLDRCKREMAQLGGSMTADVSALPAGSHQVQTADLIRGARPVRDSGLTIVSAAPGMALVELDRTIHVTGVEVKFKSTGVGSAEAIIQPAEMGLTVARTRWEELTRELGRSGAKPTLETAVVNLQALPADSNKPLRVDVRPSISGVPVQPDQPTVDVRLKVSQLADEKVLKIAVRVESPPGWDEDDTWQRFVLKRKDPLDWQKEITFRGPQKEIEKLRSEDVDAYVGLSEEDKKATEAWLERDVRVRLPAGSQIQVAGKLPTVQFRLDARTPAAGGT